MLYTVSTQIWMNPPSIGDCTGAGAGLALAICIGLPIRKDASTPDISASANQQVLFITHLQRFELSALVHAQIDSIPRDAPFLDLIDAIADLVLLHHRIFVVGGVVSHGQPAAYLAAFPYYWLFHQELLKAPSKRLIPYYFPLRRLYRKNSTPLEDSIVSKATSIEYPC